MPYLKEDINKQKYFFQIRCRLNAPPGLKKRSCYSESKTHTTHATVGRLNYATFSTTKVNGKMNQKPPSTRSMLGEIYSIHTAIIRFPFSQIGNNSHGHNIFSFSKKCTSSIPDSFNIERGEGGFRFMKTKAMRNVA